MEIKHKLDIQELEEVTKKLLQLITAKNSIYKDAWQKYGEFSIFPNIANKFGRLESILIDKVTPPDNDSKVDTVADLAAYSLMYLWWLMKNEPELFEKWKKRAEEFIKSVNENSGK